MNMCFASLSSFACTTDSYDSTFGQISKTIFDAIAKELVNLENSLGRTKSFI